MGRPRSRSEPRSSVAQPEATATRAAAKPGRRQRRSTSAAKRVQDKAPGFQGWKTTDADEIERRRWRGMTEVAGVESLEAAHPLFGTFRVRSSSGGAYEVEIRSLAERLNSCGCLDWRVNGLGTCKHIEGALAFLRRRHGARSLAQAAKGDSPRIEVYPDPEGAPALRVGWPQGEATPAAVQTLLAPDSLLTTDPLAGLTALREALAGFPPDRVRYSRHLEPRLEEERRRRTRKTNRETFLSEVAAGRATLEVVKHPLLPYQREGMLHLAFGERALLADEMGLGKTVQAIAACELLRRLRGIQRVLVVLPASLKAEWEEQIARFTDLTVNVVAGSRPQRLHAYRQEAFFTLVNYEQVIPDRHDINHLVAPQVVILDEAQRIKNWQTKTAQAVKALHSPYAFVLTGTPLENRIDEIYSIVGFLDPRLLGPLFRFNREFYVLDERGRPVDYRNLEELRRRLAPVMLRRRKDEVEEQLPGRTVETFYVPMSEEQQLRYGDYQVRAARLIQAAQRRPLTREEYERLQQWLACMRMLCDTPYILDPACREAPKLEELEKILEELLSDPGRKVIIFSEWERMLELVRELAGELGVECAWHTGSVPQQQRRLEIQRFKRDPACRLFLSTDSGSVGLNLQVASAVINLDLPWNPARLEQRIARAWRKHQTRAVTVINLVSENTIEHRMVYLLGQKQGVADGVLDGRGDLSALKMPSGRTALMERLAAMLAPPEPAPTPPPAPPPGRRLADELSRRLGEGLLLVQELHNSDGPATTLVVVEKPLKRAEARELEALSRESGAGPVEMVDRATWATIQRLLQAGVLRLGEGGEPLHRSPKLDGDTLARQEAARRRQTAGSWLEQGERKLRMATLLAEGGFAIEAATPLVEAAGMAVRALALAADGELEPEAAGALPVAELVERETVTPRLPAGSLAVLVGDSGAAGEHALLLGVAQTLLATARTAWEEAE